MQQLRVEITQHRTNKLIRKFRGRTGKLWGTRVNMNLLHLVNIFVAAPHSV